MHRGATGLTSSCRCARLLRPDHKGLYTSICISNITLDVQVRSKKVNLFHTLLLQLFRLQRWSPMVSVDTPQEALWLSFSSRRVQVIVIISLGSNLFRFVYFTFQEYFIFHFCYSMQINYSIHDYDSPGLPEWS